MSRNDKEPFLVKFLKSSDNSECFFKALEVRIVENALFDAVNSFFSFLVFLIFWTLYVLVIYFLTSFIVMYINIDVSLHIFGLM